VAPRIRDEATDGLDDRVAVERFEGKGGRFVRGEGRIVAPGRVAVDDRIIEARRGVVVATGTHAAIPPIPGWWPTGRRGPRCGGESRIGAWRTSGVL
jgi:pyruvate/2-oxoglutarate dehydrogenase complex dihydrolipoamide dehydrogenase (E3) component